MRTMGLAHKLIATPCSAHMENLIAEHEDFYLGKTLESQWI